MNISDTDLECPIRVQPYQPTDLTRAAEPQKRASSIGLLGNLALYIVPHVFSKTAGL